MDAPNVFVHWSTRIQDQDPDFVADAGQAITEHMPRVISVYSPTKFRPYWHYIVFVRRYALVRGQLDVMLIEHEVKPLEHQYITKYEQMMRQEMGLELPTQNP